jgi:cytochrome c oxidase assembly protein subunit 15
MYGGPATYLERVTMASRGITSQTVVSTATSGENGGNAWVEEIPRQRRRHLRIWLLIGAALTMLTVIVGGITRLTESGLSIVDWAPIVGAVPPLNDQDWQDAFARYQQYPEYAQLRPDMTLSDFKYIYFWEYLHRMIGRVIGLAFAVPFIVFWIRGYLTRPLMKRLLMLFALGGMQGAMGWYMVSSGLVDRPEVSHYRLAAHLLLALTIFASCVWFATDLHNRPSEPLTPSSRNYMVGTLTSGGILLAIQIFWGALVAGLNAGFILNTFPLMNGSLFPPQGLSQDPLLINLFENMATVQWIHRVLATVLLVGAIAFLIRVRSNSDLNRFYGLSTLFAGLIVLQYAVGVTTLLTNVETAIGVTHQGIAVLLVGVLVLLAHRVRHSHAVEPTAAPTTNA